MVKIVCDICGAEAPGEGNVPTTWTAFSGMIIPPASDMPMTGTSVSAHACELHPNAMLRFVEVSNESAKST